MNLDIPPHFVDQISEAGWHDLLTDSDSISYKYIRIVLTTATMYTMIV